jgi:nicotinate-nucleotide adenylyltransferase
MRVGLLGGTFDPIHRGHLQLATLARECARLDRVLLVPTGEPPHRRPPVAGAEQRLEMARLAVDGTPGMEVWDVEVRRQGPSFTVETLRDFHRRWPDDEAFLILGWDAAREIGGWRQPEEVLRLARLVVLPRPGQPLPTPEDFAELGLDPKRNVICWDETSRTAASRVRAAVAAGDSIEAMVPPAVARYIEEHRLYLKD